MNQAFSNTQYRVSYAILALALIFTGCNSLSTAEQQVEQWKETELAFQSATTYANPYTDVEFRVEFSHSDGTTLTRPGFWDGENTWKVRFASPLDAGTWTYTTYAEPTDDTGLNGQQGTLSCVPYQGKNELIKHGLLKMSSGHRNIVHADGTPFLLIGDTPWALPWRGTIASVTAYANNREARNFNAALLMSLQPDRDAEGPRSRTEAKGFAVAFEDLKGGHINDPNIAYYQYMDTLMNLLVEHGIVPVYQPVFHGFGWKGKNVLGWNVDPDEYVRYCKYLVARYGAQPAIYLVGADSDGRNVGIAEGGAAIQEWDAYQQPTGLHYSPFDEVIPDWMTEEQKKTYEPHMNRTNQAADWLDFQWAQTGHGGAHIPRKVELMYDNQPIKAVANGEPTYEGIARPDNGAGWWQGHEAWLQYTSGGTMGVAYGAGGLWNWKLFPDEEWPEWANSNISWKEAIELPGATYVGYLGNALAGLPTTDIEKHPELAGGKLCLAKPGELFVLYLPEGGKVSVQEIPNPGTYKWFDPVAGKFVADGKTNSTATEFTSPLAGPSVLIITR